MISELKKWFIFFVTYCPGYTGVKIRRYILARRCKNTGRNISLGIGVAMTGHRNIEIGDNVNIMRFSSIHGHNGVLIMGSNISCSSNACIDAAEGGEIRIGNNVLLAQNVVIRASDHEHRSMTVPIIEQGHTGGKVVIGNDCWICANAVITRNVNIGDHSIVAAGAVVTKDVEPFSVVGGVPAELLYKRSSVHISDQ